MATRKKSSGSGSRFGTFLFGFLCALVVAAAGAWVYLHWGPGLTGPKRPTGLVQPTPLRTVPLRHAPASGPAVSPGSANPGAATESNLDQPSAEAGALNPAPSAASAPPTNLDHPILKPPFDVSEDVFEAGAHVYKQQCANCHGIPGHDAALAQRMEPPASQLWKKASSGSATGVSDHPPGETFWQIKDGVRRSGMPSYQHVLSDNQIWDVALLLQNAGQQLPDPIAAILRRP